MVKASCLCYSATEADVPLSLHGLHSDEAPAELTAVCLCYSATEADVPLSLHGLHSEEVPAELTAVCLCYSATEADVPLSLHGLHSDEAPGSSDAHPSWAARSEGWGTARQPLTTTGKLSVQHLPL